MIRVGDQLELWYDDAWFEVEVTSLDAEAQRALAARKATVQRNNIKRKNGSLKDVHPDELELTQTEVEEDAQDPRRFIVTAPKFNRTHIVLTKRLRPRWLWASDTGMWRFELLSGHACVPIIESGCGTRATFTFAQGLLRARTC